MGEEILKNWATALFSAVTGIAFATGSTNMGPNLWAFPVVIAAIFTVQAVFHGARIDGPAGLLRIYFAKLPTEYAFFFAAFVITLLAPQ